MTNCRLSLLAVVVASLVCNHARAQTQFESSRNGFPADSRTAPAQQNRSVFGGNQPGVVQGQNPAEDPARAGWLQRLVFGKPEESANAPAAGNSAPLVTNSRSASPAPVGPPVSSRQPAATVAATPTPPVSKPATNDESSNWLRQLVLGKPEQALKTPAGDATAQSAPAIGRSSGELATGPISSRVTAPPVTSQPIRPAQQPTIASQQPTIKSESLSPAEADKTSWMNRLPWRKPDEPPSSRSPAATAQTDPAAKTASRWSLANAESKPAAPAATAALHPSIKRLPEVAGSNVASQPSALPQKADSRSIAAAEAEPRSGSLSNWLSRLQRRTVDQASAVTGPNAGGPRVASRTVDSEIVFQPPPTTSTAGAFRLPPPDPLPAPSSSRTTVNSSTAANVKEPRSESWLTQQFAGGLGQEAAAPLATAAPETAKTAVETAATARPTSRRLPPPNETVRDTSRLAVAERAPALTPPSLNPPAASPKVQAPEPAPEAPRFAESLAAGARSSLSAVNPFSDDSAPRTIHELHEQIAAQQPTITAAVPASATTPYARPKIIFRPITMNSHANHGNALLRPVAQVVAEGADTPLVPPQTTMPDAVVTEDLPSPEGLPGEMEYPIDEEWMPMGNEKEAYGVGGWKECWYRLMANLNGPRSCPPGIGVENVMNAPFWLETTQPINNCVVRADAAADWEFPDRLEYFWPRTPGPKGVQTGYTPPPGVLPDTGEPELDYQDVQFYIERGGDRFSVGTLLPIRAVDPEDRFNTAGFADMTVTPKMVLLDGKDWQISHVFKTHIPTGSHRRGTGNGHVSLEPGVAWRYKWSDVTYFHGDLTYWFPIAADLEQAGQFLNYGIGISHVLYDSDCYAVMPTFEINAWTLLDGRETLPRSVLFNEIDTIGIINLHPGVRVVCDTAGDCGVREFGITSGVAVTQEHWYSEIVRIELRWVF